MATAKTMSKVATVINILLQMQADGLIQLLRLKERFLSQPSGGGERMFYSSFLPLPAPLCDQRHHLRV